MGVTGYTRWLQEEFGGAFVKHSSRVPRRYDHVYIDVNNLLHVAAHHSNSESSFFKKLFTLLDNRLNKTNPRHGVTLALDGPAPMAKTITQRKRRIRLSAGAATPLSEEASKMLKIGITPGSVLALKIDRALEYYVARRMLRRDRNGAPVDKVLYEISSMRVAGEGEIKLVKSIQQRMANPRFQGHSHCIVTEDSDALLLAMILFGQGKGRGRKRYASNERFEVYVMGGNEWVFIARKFDHLLLNALPRGASLDSARRDFVGLSAMMGNDYIPSSKLGAKTAWKTYLEMRETYLFRDDPLFPMPESVDELNRQSSKNTRAHPEQAKGLASAVNWVFLRHLARRVIATQRHDSKRRDNDGKGAPERHRKRAYEYMWGVEWMLNMYFNGECEDFSFHFTGQGPTSTYDFLSVPDEYDVSCDPLVDLKRAEASFYNSRPVTPLAYSLAVIPRGGRKQISNNIRRLVDPKSPIREMFAMDYCSECIRYRMHVAPMENALSNTLASKDPGFSEVVPSNAQFSRFSRFTDDEGYIIDPETGEYMSMDEVRKRVKELSRAHLQHLHSAPQHANEDPICLPTVEAAVARLSADNVLTEEEEELRTLATSVLFWRHTMFDPKDVDARDFADEEELSTWYKKIVPNGYPILQKEQTTEIRKFDGDIDDVVRRWGVDNEHFKEMDDANASIAASRNGQSSNGRNDTNARARHQRNDQSTSATTDAVSSDVARPSSRRPNGTNGARTDAKRGTERRLRAVRVQTHRSTFARAF